MTRAGARGLAAAAASLALLALLAEPAAAHDEAGRAAGFASGIRHPWSGLDHVAAMVAVGIWGAQLGPPAIWLLPVTFPMVMAFGGALGLAGVPVPGVEGGIALSAVLLGGMVLFEARPRPAAAAALVGAFAVFHGLAHGRELPEGEGPLLYSLGFVTGTGCLHGSGIALGLVHRWERGKGALRAVGGGIALLGAWFLVEAFR